MLLRMNRMNALLEHTWQDMTATVQAGCPWTDMQAELARHGQFVALDPLWPARATIARQYRSWPRASTSLSRS